MSRWENKLLQVACVCIVVAAMVRFFSGCGPSQPLVEGEMVNERGKVFQIKTKTGIVITRQENEGYLYISDDGKAEWFGPGAPNGKEPK